MRLVIIAVVENRLQAVNERKKDSITFVWLVVYITTCSATTVMTVVADLFLNTRKYQRIPTLLSYQDSGVLESHRSSSGAVKISCVPVYVMSLALIISVVKLGRPSNGTVWAFFPYSSQIVFYQQLFSDLTPACVSLNACLSASCHCGLAVLPVHNKDDLLQLNQCLGASEQIRCQRRPLADRYRKLRRVHSALCHLSQEVLSAHETFLVSFIVTALCTISWNVVAIILSLWHRRPDVVHILVLSWQSSQMLKVIAASYALSRDATQTAPVLCRLLLGSTPRSSETVELRHLCRQARSQSPTHQLYGVVPIDMRMLVASLSFVTTYSVVLLNFWQAL
ncbi:uncharacterized protein LOC126253233 [Schistocerca nitens]|uniref:uncharacterized protein LOC126253233 n=1 Tax=Schistocerca nitens TaxID=7011 RepID=UPI002117C42D|nr:uncharacterized protein LOC126253233 [Schistocerca nitens]